MFNIGFFNFFKKKETIKKVEIRLPKIEKAIIPYPKKLDAIDYSGMIEDVRAYFGKLYKNNDYSFFNYNTLHISIKVGVYFGYTKYNGQINRNGIKAIDLCLPDNSILATLDKSLWKRYDKEIGIDNAKWIGYSDGESIRVTVFKDKASEGIINSFLQNVGEWIANVSWSRQLYKMAELLNLNSGDFEYKKKQTGKGYDYYYNGKYILSGVSHYVATPFVSLGFAKPEPDNPFNREAVAIYTDKGIKVGYISEKELNLFHTENTGVIPIVMEAHYYKDKLCGYVYTFTNNKEEYHYIRNQFERLLKNV